MGSDELIEAQEYEELIDQLAVEAGVLEECKDHGYRMDPMNIEDPERVAAFVRGLFRKRDPRVGTRESRAWTKKPSYGRF